MTTYPKSDPKGPTIVADGAGGMIAVWQDGRSFGDDLYGQRFDAVGNELWLAGGMPVCWTLGNPSGETGISDGRGGMIVAWLDPRSLVDVSVYVERIYSNGGWIPFLRRRIRGLAHRRSATADSQPCVRREQIRFRIHKRLRFD
jgi:hypothetical protein